MAEMKLTPEREQEAESMAFEMGTTGWSRQQEIARELVALRAVADEGSNFAEGQHGHCIRCAMPTRLCDCRFRTALRAAGRDV